MKDKEMYIGSRGSQLAKKQTDLFIRRLKKIGIYNFKVKFIKTQGDKVSKVKFKELGGKGLFTKDIDEMILDSRLDLGVHSAKDIPGNLSEKLVIGAYLKREDVRDVLLTNNLKVKSLMDLPYQCTLGTSSLRRICFIKLYRPDIKIMPIRGNIETRIKKIQEKKVEAIIIAKAGLNRLKIGNHNLNVLNIPVSKIMPAVGQGAIAIVHRKNDSKMKDICKKIDHEETRLLMNAERSLLSSLDGDCTTPIAVISRLKEDNLLIKGRLFSIDGNNFVDEKITIHKKKAKHGGASCAKEILKKVNFKYKV